MKSEPKGPADRVPSAALIARLVGEITESEIVVGNPLADQSARIFRAVADCTYDWESWLDLNGKVVWVNPAVERLTGHSVAECLSFRDYPLEMLAPEDVEMFQQLLMGAQAGSSGNDVEFRVVRKDGVVSWFAVSWQPLRNSSGQPLGIRMSKRDISDRKAMEEQLRKHSQELEQLASQRARRIVELEQRRLQMQKLAALGQMSASIAHEVNNPLAGIKNALRLIRDREQFAPGNMQLLQLVDKEIERIAALLSQMHQLCKPSISPPHPVCVINVLNEVIALASAHCAPKRVLVQRVAWPKRLKCMLREAEVRQILHNLLANAFEASAMDGVVQIKLEVVDEQLRVDIIDQGEGISEELLPHIFEPFVTTRHDSRRSGLGLGLSISNSLAQALGGTIEVDSRRGHGATFSLRFPLVSTDLVE